MERKRPAPSDVVLTPRRPASVAAPASTGPPGGQLQGGSASGRLGEGGMLFGPGNPVFNRTFQTPDQSSARPEGARFDPFGPAATAGGNPNWDDAPMPGPINRPPNPAPGNLGGFGNNFL